MNMAGATESCLLVLLEVASKNRLPFGKVGKQFAHLRKGYSVGAVGVYDVQEAGGQVVGILAQTLQQLREFNFVDDAISILVHPSEGLHQRLQVLLVAAQLVVQHALHERLIADPFALMLELQLVLLFTG